MLTGLSDPTETTPAAAGSRRRRISRKPPAPDFEEHKALEMGATASRPAAARLIPPDTRHLAAVPAEKSRP